MSLAFPPTMKVWANLGAAVLFLLLLAGAEPVFAHEPEDCLARVSAVVPQISRGLIRRTLCERPDRLPHEAEIIRCALVLGSMLKEQAGGALTAFKSCLKHEELWQLTSELYRSLESSMRNHAGLARERQDSRKLAHSTDAPASRTEDSP